MRFLLLLLPFVLLCLSLSASARPASSNIPHVVHEKRNVIPAGWERGVRVPSSAQIPLRIALKQSNLDTLESELMRVSDPDSKEFGQHWTPEAIASKFAPSQETVNAVVRWLKGQGIEESRIEQSESLGWLTVRAEVGEVEDLLKTRFHVYRRDEEEQATIGTDEYSVPEEIQQHIDFITPTLHFIRSSRRDIKRRDAYPLRISNSEGSPSSGSLPKEQSLRNPFGVIDDLKNCSNSIVPICLRALYGIPELFGPQISKDALGILEFTPQSYVQTDLDRFFHDYAPTLVGRKPDLVSIDGGYVNATATNFSINGESNLDLQYAMTLSQLETTLYQVGDAVAGASFSDFLDALDGDFCQYDDPTQDVSYPDNNTTDPRAYKGPKQCGGITATKVISVSYGQDEHELTPLYAMRQCQEYAKLGLKGTTFVFSSGDYGVAGNGGKCQRSGNDDKSQNGTRFAPEYPASCPYILAVGATQVKANTSVIGTSDPEEACETVIQSGGGFSDIFKRPSYQDEAVSAYLEAHPPSYSSAQYNTSGSRAIPDISANGAHYHVVVAGQYKGVYGTSASAPVWAALISRFNENRARIGKGPLGFINPTLYKYAKQGLILKDITKGHNPGCGTQGFEAVQGYDPLTGLGTPNYEALNALFLSLP